ncbi:MAG: 3-deoxy-8-phosphooctulonate synthase [Sulfurospirillaceae bacterium]|nr:3-deoxy-8-phosphooctulonate synthase [Sulfurospirillaceae bacterium]MDD3462653.1 3-deoxy-8-phosphooctulonate synthase [Sulfurospirillaceae bacterium]
MILIAGPCVIESRENLFSVARELERYHLDDSIDFYFKSSFDKANRTSIGSFRGPGMDEGLKLLDDVRKEFGFKLLTDIHDYTQAKPAGEVVDVLQIPAFLCRQTDLLVAAAKTDCVVNIKKGQFLNPYDMRYSVKKILETRDVQGEGVEVAKEAKVWLTERGTTFGYGNLVVDMRALMIMREFAPVIFDATHSVQMPGAEGGKSGGKREFVAPLSRAAAAVGVDGFFFETHTSPCDALCDGPNMLDLKALYKAISDVKAIQESLSR